MIEQAKGTREIAADMTINQIVAEHPETLTVFNKYGIDACCGGGLPLAEVARKHRIEFITLLADLEMA